MEQLARRHEATADEERAARPPVPAAVPALALAAAVGNHAFTTLVARQEAAATAEPGTEAAAAGGLSPEDAERLTGMVLPKLQVAVGLLESAKGKPLGECIPSALGHLRPVLPVLQVLDPKPGSEAERVLRAEVEFIKDEIATLEAVLAGSPKVAILPYWSRAYAETGKILQTLKADPEQGTRAAFLLEHSVMPAIESALREIDSPDIGRVAWDHISTLTLIETAAKDEQLEGTAMPAVAGDFRRGIQIAGAIADGADSAIGRSASILGGVHDAMSAIAVPGRPAPRRPREPPPEPVPGPSIPGGEMPGVPACPEYGIPAGEVPAAPGGQIGIPAGEMPAEPRYPHTGPLP